MNVLIVDDEMIVREGLKAIIAWEDLGFSVCGEGVDGGDALEKMLLLKPEITLLDIKMPKIHGIEVAELARKGGYTGKIIILSGYSDFQYAQRALRFGADAYLLKPVDEVELTDAVNKARIEIETQNEASEQIKQNKKTAKDNLLTNILLGKDWHKEELSDCNMQLGDGPYQVVLIESDEPNEGDSIDDLIKLPIIRPITKTIIGGRLVLLLKESESIDMLSEILEFILGSGTENRTFAAIGGVFSSCFDIKKSYADAENAIKRKFFYKREKKAVYWDNIEEISLAEARDTIKLEEMIERICFCIEAGEIKKMNPLLHEIEKTFQLVTMPAEKIKGIFIGLYIEVRKRVLNTYPQILNLTPVDSDAANQICDKIHLYEIIDCLQAEFNGFIDCIKGEKCNIVLKMLSFMKKNSSQKLELRSLALLFGYNSAYLGKVFRKETGESFNSYLDMLRIKHAVKLLSNENLKIYEVCEMAGYRSLDYFYKRFKKHTKLSPSEYRKKLIISSKK